MSEYGPNLPSSQIDQRGQTILGPQTNINNYYGNLPNGTPIPLSPVARCDFYHQEHLPTNYIVRHELLTELRNALLQTEANIALTSSLRQTDALFGMGGIGKTVMARALCDDPVIQAAFPHGILWATLGQTPDLTARLRDWIYALGGAIPPTALTPDALTNILTQILQSRCCLLIVDDVWQRAHLKPFMVNAPNCRLLFTTRIADIATEVKATIRPIPVMSQDQAINLLTGWAGEPSLNINRPLQEAIVKRLGRLPLAIKLAGDQLRRHEPENWLATFGAHKLGRRRPQNLHDSLETTFALSLADLAAEERRLFNALAIFPDDEAIPLCAIVKLWQILAAYTAVDTVDLLHYLADRALLQLVSAPYLPKTTNYPQMAVIFHDLIRDFMTAELGVDGRHAAHQALLNAYRQTQRHPGWHNAPNDGYLYEHLVYHLGEVVQHEVSALDELVALFTTPAWLQVRVSAADYRYDGYLRDLDKAWTVCRTRYQSDNITDLVQILPLHTRFALVRASINSLAANYGPALVGYAVNMGFWPMMRALGIFEQISDPLHKARMGCSLLAMGTMTELEREIVLYQALAGANAVAESDIQLRTLIALAHQQWNDERVHMLNNLMNLMIRLPSVWQQVQAFAEFAPLLYPQQYAAALDWVNRITETHYRIEAAIHLLVHAAELSSEKREVISALLTEDDPAHFTAVFHKMVYLWPVVHDCTALILQTFFESAAPEQADTCLRNLVSLLDPSQQKPFLQQAQAAALAIFDEEHRALILGVLACHLTTDLQEQLLLQLLTTISAISDERLQANVLNMLATRFTNKPTVHSSWRALLTIPPEEGRAGILMALVPHLRNSHVIQQALTAISAIKNKSKQITILVALIPYFNEEEQKQILKQALSTVSIIKYEEEQAEVLATLAPYLHSKQMLQRALSAAMAIKSETWRAEALIALVPYFSDRQRTQVITQALNAAMAIKYETWRAEALIDLLPYFHSQQRGQLLELALTAANAIKYSEERSQILATLAPHLPNESILQQVLSAASTIEDKVQQSAEPSTSILHFQGEQTRQRTLIAPNATMFEQWWTEIWPAFALYFSNEKQEQILAQVYTITRTLDNIDIQTEALKLLATYLSNQQQAMIYQHTLSVAGTNEIERNCVDAISMLTPYLHPEIKEKVLVQYLKTKLPLSDAPKRHDTLIRLLPYIIALPVACYCNVLKSIQDEWLRSDLISHTIPLLTIEAHITVANLLPQLPDPLNRAKAAARLTAQPSLAAVETQLQTAVAISDEEQRAKLYLTLSKSLPSQQQPTAIAMIVQTLSHPDQPTDFVTAQLFLTAADEGVQRTHSLSHLLHFAAAIAEPSERITALISLVPDLEPASQAVVIEYAMNAIQEISDLQQRVTALLPILPWLAIRLRDVVVRQLYKEAFTLTDVATRARTFAAVFPYLDTPTQQIALQRAITAAQVISDPLDCITILTQIAASGDQRACKLAQANVSTLDTMQKALSMALLLPVASVDDKNTLLQQGLQIAWTLPQSVERAMTLAHYLPYVSDPAPIYKELLLTIIDTIHTHAQSGTRAALLDYLATEPLLQKAQLPAAIVYELIDTVVEICNEWHWL